MYRFYSTFLKAPKTAFLFQYIICIGSTKTLHPHNQELYNFNTSYVSVLLIHRQKLCLVHLYFNTSYVSVLQLTFRQPLSALTYFNTSYVSVLLIVNILCTCDFFYFNTSYVSVLQTLACQIDVQCPISIHHMYRFYVPLSSSQPTTVWISIHHMYRFYWEKELQKLTLELFQYIICIGSTKPLFASHECVFAFQYIICIGSTHKGSNV